MRGDRGAAILVGIDRRLLFRDVPAAPTIDRGAVGATETLLNDVIDLDSEDEETARDFHRKQQVGLHRVCGNVRTATAELEATVTAPLR
ncbi:hypothetical protein MTO96_004207 [Rhipicephalus appendiculatus]